MLPGFFSFNPAARAKAYLDDVSDPESMFMELANGVKIIKFL